MKPLLKTEARWKWCKNVALKKGASPRIQDFCQNRLRWRDAVERANRDIGSGGQFGQ
jgi:hypothetical protein